MNAKVQALLNGETVLSDLDGDQLDELGRLVAAEFAAIDPGPDAAVDEDTYGKMNRFADVAEQVKVEADSRAAATERASRAGAIREKFAATPEPEPVAQETPEPEVETPATEPASEPVPVAASATVRPTLAQLAQHNQPAEPARTAPRRITADTVLTAAANMPGIGLGEQVDFDELARSTTRKLELLRNSTTEERHITASLAWNYPEDRQLGDDAWANTRRMDEALSVRSVMNSVEEQGGMAAIVAAGGICGPTPVDYTINIDTTAARPIRDSLPSFQATRGGLRFVPPPSFASVGSSATVVWTAANDASPSSPTAKPVQEFDCPTPVEVLVDAIPTRIQFSNFSARFSPEIVAANTELAMANAARLAEVNLLSKMAAGSTKTGAGTLISFTRDWLALADELAVGWRHRHRLPADFPFQMYAPSWALGAVRTDILREQAHDRSNASSDSLAMANSEIVRLFAARNIVPTWTLDSLPKSVAGNTLSAAGAWDYPDQGFAAPATTAALSAAPPDASANSASAGTWWPKRLTFFLFPAGTFVFLDGGRIDLGVIRDSTLNATNKYQSFIEPFEGLAKRGVESLQVTVPTSLTGISVAAAAAPSAASAYAY